ncbi:hypothetical protein Tco_0541413 [Tanacetum coccineum]
MKGRYRWTRNFVLFPMVDTVAEFQLDEETVLRLNGGGVAFKPATSGVWRCRNRMLSNTICLMNVKVKMLRFMSRWIGAYHVFDESHHSGLGTRVINSAIKSAHSAQRCWRGTTCFSLEEYNTAKTAFEAGCTLSPNDARVTYTKCKKCIADTCLGKEFMVRYVPIRIEENDRTSDGKANEMRKWEVSEPGLSRHGRNRKHLGFVFEYINITVFIYVEHVVKTSSIHVTNDPNANVVHAHNVSAIDTLWCSYSVLLFMDNIATQQPFLLVLMLNLQKFLLLRKLCSLIECLEALRFLLLGSTTIFDRGLVNHWQYLA